MHIGEDFSILFLRLTKKIVEKVNSNLHWLAEKRA